MGIDEEGRGSREVRSRFAKSRTETSSGRSVVDCGVFMSAIVISFALKPGIPRCTVRGHADCEGRSGSEVSDRTKHGSDALEHDDQMAFAGDRARAFAIDGEVVVAP